MNKNSNQNYLHSLFGYELQIYIVGYCSWLFECSAGIMLHTKNHSGFVRKVLQIWKPFVNFQRKQVSQKKKLLNNPISM